MQEPYAPHVAVKLAKLMSHAEQMRGWSQALIAEANGLRDQLAELKYSIHQLETYRASPIVDTGAGGPLGVDPERLSHLRTEAEQIDARIEGCVAEHKKRHEIYGIAQHTVNVCKNWLARLPEGTELGRAAPVKLSNGGDHKKTLSVVRNELADVQERLRLVKDAALPLDELDRRAAQWVADRARSPRPHVQAGLASFEVVWTRATKPPFDRTNPDPVTLLCKLMPDQMQGLLVESYREQHGLEGALTDADRESRIGELSKKIAELELQEEALVMALFDGGNSTVARRRDASPAVVLGAVVGTAIAKKEAA